MGGPAETDLARASAEAIDRAFDRYRREFAEITRRAPERFRRRDWPANRQDVVERLDLHGRAVGAAVDRLVRLSGPQLEDRPAWAAIKDAFARRSAGRADGDLARTFFNSVTRRVFTIVGVDPTIEFLDDELETRAADVDSTRRVHVRSASMVDLVRDVLCGSPFAGDFEDLDASAALITSALEAERQASYGDAAVEAIEVLKAPFYRGFGVYLIGRARVGPASMPLAIALMMGRAGVVADAALATEDEVSIVFSFTRSHFLVDAPCSRDVVGFLEQIMPRKPTAELYVALGHVKHAKTVLYRDLRHHLARTQDRFGPAPGDRGMVMIVFTMPSFDVVFKVIRDRFAYPKKTARDDVVARYRLVFRHDRAGRLVDAQEFELLVFARSLFDPALLDELTSQAGDTVHVDGDRVVIDHVYVERRVTPLNLYIQRQGESDALPAILDYGQAVKDLAASNVFPGDLLLKNFGVTRHGRVIFYDYDELCLVSDCRFRDLPEARDAADEMRSEPWFFVGEADVFPEEFPAFIGLGAASMRMLRERHGEIFDADYWRRVQAEHRQGRERRIFAYSEKKRFHGPGASLD